MRPDSLCRGGGAQEVENANARQISPRSRLKYNLIREHVDAVSGPAVNVSDILPKVLARGCTKEHLAETLTEYEQLGVWHLNHDRSIIRFAASDGDGLDGL